jgi:importin subunit beta-1
MYAASVLPYLNTYLQNPDNLEAFKTSLFCLADIARGLEDKFADYLGVLDYLI